MKSSFNLSVMKQLKRLFAIMTIVYVIFGIVIFIFQRKFVYYPSPQDFSSCPNFHKASKVTHNGTRMYVSKATDDWIIIYHGNAGSACDRSHFLHYFDPRKYSYIIVEYTGYSNDQDHPSQAALLKNVEAVNDYLKSQSASQVTLVGESLGGALAAYHSSLIKVHKLLFISPFNSAQDLAQYHYWFYPIYFMVLDKYPSEQWVTGANSALIIHGTQDRIIPPKFGKILFEKIDTQDKTFVEIPGADHNDIYDYELTTTSILDYLK
jgi:uncharacterized protein